ncbi:RNA polymerase sigma factor [Oxalobacteraceae bacterium R-40]|uniref:RNA polymerase sigma factor n=1 Tax=Keguizhuia sedimenti TaxID=3064264 RepID=A0ABU1BS18_9BURK|nr:RNA polymerase sigma factor [Oxalobacteraceae bacterium R-40]
MHALPVNTAPDRNMSDPELLDRILSGDKSAFEQLMRRYNRALYRTARSILKDDTEAEDALQDAYLLAYRGLGKFRGESSLSTWLTRIVVNESIAHSRKTARTAKIIDFGTGLDEAASANQMPRNEPKTDQPDEIAMRAQMRKLIEKKIDDLPDTFRTVFMLRALEEMTVEETAACLNIPEATVRTRYFRAKGLLREALSREIDYGLEDAFNFDGERCDRIVKGTLQRLEEAESAGTGTVIASKDKAEQART